MTRAEIGVLAAAAVTAAALALGLNYLFALAGHPSAVWLMRDILGLM